ncbi:MAG: ABC transporter substrate-binding protein [Oscillospiraceae bacterium]|nr:ABC transporter substrate-binding protein [Oscillospiraceae bacterium]
MKIKKILASAMIGILLTVSLSGCATNGTNDSNGTTGTNETGAPDTVKYKIGLCQTTQHQALDAATKGFEEKLTSLLGKDNVEFDLQNASGESTACSTIVNQFVSSKYDLIFANATAALQSSAAATSDIPIVGTSITDYASALDIDDWNGKTNRNITGTSDLAPLKEQAEMFKELLPDVKKIGLLYCSNESNSKYQVDIVAEELKKLGYEAIMYPFSDSNDVAAVTTALCGACDAMYIPTDNTAASSVEIIANIVTPANIPVIASEEGICEGCGVATLSISYYSLGEVTAQMAFDILKNNADPATMEIKYADNLTKKYVPERAAALGITVPEGYEAITAE